MRRHTGALVRTWYEADERSKETRSIAEASVDQARKAIEKFITTAGQTAGSIEERGASMRVGEGYPRNGYRRKGVFRRREKRAEALAGRAGR
jgi:hypothetical protein